MKFLIKKSRSFFRKIGSCASYASYASYAQSIRCFHQKPSNILPENIEIIGMGLRQIHQPFQRVNAAYAIVIGGRIVVKRQNQFGV